MGTQDLLDQINFQALECLNEQPNHNVANALKQGYREDAGLYLESDTDEQLCINVHFQQKVKIQSLIIKGLDDGTAPKTVKLYVNRPSLGFSDVGSVPAAQELELTTAQTVSGEPIKLQYVKFQSVTVLTIFVESNQGGAETTKILKLAINGVCGDVFNVAEIKKVEHDH